MRSFLCSRRSPKGMNTTGRVRWMTVILFLLAAAACGSSPTVKVKAGGRQSPDDVAPRRKGGTAGVRYFGPVIGDYAPTGALRPGLRDRSAQAHGRPQGDGRPRLHASCPGQAGPSRGLGGFQAPCPRMSSGRDPIVALSRSAVRAAGPGAVRRGLSALGPRVRGRGEGISVRLRNLHRRFQREYGPVFAFVLPGYDGSGPGSLAESGPARGELFRVLRIDGGSRPRRCDRRRHISLLLSPAKPRRDRYAHAPDRDIPALARRSVRGRSIGCEGFRSSS